MIGCLACGKRPLDWGPILLMRHAPERLVSIGTDNKKQSILCFYLLQGILHVTVGTEQSWIYFLTGKGYSAA